MRIKLNWSKGLPLVLCLGSCVLIVNNLWASELTIQHHNLDVVIHPEQHRLIVQDTLTVQGNLSPSFPIPLLLNRNLTVNEIKVDDTVVQYDEKSFLREKGDQKDDRESRDPSEGDDQGRILLVHLPASIGNDSQVNVTITYHGAIQDPPRAAPGLRFVRPDQTRGHIGPEGVYLTSETRWYPDIVGSLATFHIRLTVPKGWEPVTQGKEIARKSGPEQFISEWVVNARSEALTVVANRFMKQHRHWNGIEIAAYLFPEDAHLADQYLNATERYLDFYTKLLGPYPFSKFAVVENFFPSGIGLPSFTLLGHRIIKRGYIQPYSLGHEIVHSWFGNSLFNDVSKGNWVEGLTTYLANYYYEELNEPVEQVHKNRRRMIYEYNLYATPTQEYPLVKFHHKETRVDNAIGYQKAAMVFHMLRGEIGDEDFFSGIRTLVKRWTGGYAGWRELAGVFGEVADRDLQWFFTQWVERPGAPLIKIKDSQVQTSSDSENGFMITLTVLQEKPAYRVRIPVVIALANGNTHATTIILEHPTQSVNLAVPTRPTFLAIDPDYETLRRLRRDQIPPMLNLWVTDPFKVVVSPEGWSREEQTAYQPILKRIRTQGGDVAQRTDMEMPFDKGSVLVLGGPGKNRYASKAAEGCGDTVQLDSYGASLQEHHIEGDQFALLVSCPIPGRPGLVATIFYGFSPAAALRVARLLFFYGWDSYLVFQNGKVVTRGTFVPPAKDLEVKLEYPI